MRLATLAYSNGKLAEAFGIPQVQIQPDIANDAGKTLSESESVWFQ